MENETIEAPIKLISQILVYVSLRYASEGIKKDLILSMSNVYGTINENSKLLYLYDSNKKYIGVIDMNCPHIVTSIAWGNKEE